MSRPLVVCVPVTTGGQVDPRWGRAARIAVADLDDGAITRWQELGVGWDELHDQGTEGGHHARIARFLQDHDVQVVVANHMGPGMVKMLDRMGLIVRLGAAGDAREATLAAVTGRAGAPSLAP